MHAPPTFLALALALALALVACAGSPGAGTNGAPPLESGALAFQDHTRTYRYGRPTTPGLRPLVVALHGRLGDGEGMDRLSHLSAVAAREGFIVVFPDGVRRSWADARGVTPASKQGIDDVGFLVALIDDFVARQGADPSRIYMLGMSNGGFMTLTFACAHPEKLAAAATVTGGLDTGLIETCRRAPVLPLAFVFGDEDPLVPFNGGTVAGAGGTIVAARTAAAFFAKRNGCGANPAKTLLPDADPTDGTSVERSVFCPGSAEVELHVIHGGGHAWPGGWAYLSERFIGRTSRDIDASETLWRFLAPHRR